MSLIDLRLLSFYDKEVLLIFTNGKLQTFKQIEHNLTQIHATGILRVLSCYLKIQEQDLVRSVIRLHQLGFLHTILHDDKTVSYLLTMAGKKALNLKL